MPPYPGPDAERMRERRASSFGAVAAAYATLATHSAVLVMQDAERDRLLGEVREYLASRPETAAGEFTVPLVTAVVRVIRA
jgi:hypothetical protein